MSDTTDQPGEARPLTVSKNPHSQRIRRLRSDLAAANRARIAAECAAHSLKAEAAALRRELAAAREQIAALTPKPKLVYTCVSCQSTFHPKRKNARFCSRRCTEREGMRRRRRAFLSSQEAQEGGKTP